jgi:hypothetical protein
MFSNAPEFDYVKSVIRKRMANGQSLREAIFEYRDILANIIARCAVGGNPPSADIVREYEFFNWCVYRTLGL